MGMSDGHLEVSEEWLLRRRELLLGRRRKLLGYWGAGYIFPVIEFVAAAFAPQAHAPLIGSGIALFFLITIMFGFDYHLLMARIRLIDSILARSE